MWFPALEDNIVLDDAHDHDGTDSPLLPPGSIVKSTSSITAAQWSSDGNGNYSKVVTVPSGISSSPNFADIKYYDLIIQIETVGATFGDRVYPGIERESATTFTVRVNDNTLDLLIYYV